MNMRFEKRLLTLAVLFAGLAMQAQQKGTAQASIQYNFGIPAGSLKSQVSENSPRGMQASILFGLNNNLALGLGTGFQDFYQKYPRQLYKLSDGSDLSGVRTFSIQTIPILLQAKWSFTPGAAVQPFAALGVGGNLIDYSDLVGEFSFDKRTKFGFAARPQAGVFVPFKKQGETGLTVGASYNVMPFKQGDLTNLNHIGIQAGITVPLRK